MSINLTIPLDVPLHKTETFTSNYTALCHSTNNLFFLAADHKIEHLNDDFYGPGISPDALNPEHTFRIASQSKIGTLATQFGLIMRYAANYSNLRYVVKINSKTNLLPVQTHEPNSRALYSVDQIVQIAKERNIKIAGIGYTIYLGSEHEQEMLVEAAQVVHEAHQHGLVAMLWVYPRGKAITHPTDAQLVAGAAGLANALGADAVKLQLPAYADGAGWQESIRVIVQAAGNTKVIASGGVRVSQDEFIKVTKAQLACSVHGAAIGRNIYQLPLNQAIDLANLLSDIIFTL